MSVTVMVPRPVELTPTQVKLLMFFGGLLTVPPVGSTTASLDVLERQGLVKPIRGSRKFVISKIGQDVLAELEKRRVLGSDGGGS